MERHTINSKTTKKKSGNKIVSEAANRLSGGSAQKLTSSTLKKSSASWLKRHLRDPFVLAAKKQNFLSRAAYKLLEIDDTYKIFTKTKNKVIDLGSAPGSWMQVAWDHLHNHSSILIGVDLLDILFLGNNDSTLNCKTFAVKGDFMEEQIQQNIVELLQGKADIILSDIAPNTIGIKSVDHLVLANICENIINFAGSYLNKNGTLVMKIFQGTEQKKIQNDLQKMFKEVHICKPKASRKESSEVYFVAKSKK